MSTNLMKKIGAGVGAICLAAGLSGLSQPASAAGDWDVVEKKGCFELMSNGTFYTLTQVCQSPAGNDTGLYTHVTMGGERHAYCIGKHQTLGLGVQTEWDWERDSSWPSGCKVKDEPYPVF